MNITINGHEINTPDSWNDLTHRQLFALYGMLMAETDDIVPPEEVVSLKRIMMMKYLLNMDDQFMKDWEADCMKEEGGRLVFDSELAALLSCTDCFFDIIHPEEGEEGPTQYQLSLSLTKNPLPILERRKSKGIKKLKLYAPADELDNLTIYELGTVFSLFESYLKDPKDEKVDELLATLYRPHKPTTKRNKREGYQGDVRYPLINTENLVPVRQREIAKLPKSVKAVLLFWFASCRQKVISSYPDIFTSSGAGQKGRDFGWAGVLMALAGDLTKVDDVSQQSYHSAFIYISHLKEQRRIASKTSPVSS